MDYRNGYDETKDIDGLLCIATYLTQVAYLFKKGILLSYKKGNGSPGSACIRMMDNKPWTFPKALG